MAARPSVRRCPLLVGLAVCAGGRPDGGAAGAGGLRERPGATNAGATTFQWSAVAADLGFNVVRYEGGLGARRHGLRHRLRGRAGAPLAGHLRLPGPRRATRPARGPPRPGGPLRHVHAGGRPHAADDLSLSPRTPNGNNGWYRSLAVEWTCSDAGSRHQLVPGSRDRRPAGREPAANRPANDAAGNPSAQLSDVQLRRLGAADRSDALPEPGRDRRKRADLRLGTVIRRRDVGSGPL